MNNSFHISRVNQGSSGLHTRTQQIDLLLQLEVELLRTCNNTGWNYRALRRLQLKVELLRTCSNTGWSYRALHRLQLKVELLHTCSNTGWSYRAIIDN